MGLEDLARASQFQNNNQQQTGNTNTGRWGVPSSYKDMQDAYNKLSTAGKNVRLETPDMKQEEPKPATEQATFLDKLAKGAGDISSAIFEPVGDYEETWKKGDKLGAAGQFLMSLPIGTISAMPEGVKELYQAATGRDVDTIQDDEISTESLTKMQRFGNLGSGVINTAGGFFGGSREFMKTLGNAGKLIKTGGKETLKNPYGGILTKEGKSFGKQVLGDIAEEGIEEGVQQAFEDMEDEQLGEDTFGRMAKAAALGGLGGGIMSAGFGAINRGIDRAVNGRPQNNDSSGELDANNKNNDQGHLADFFKVVDGYFGEADQGIAEEVLKRQSDQYRTSGATSSKALIGDFNMRLNEAYLSARDLKTLFDANEDAGEIMFNSLNYGRDKTLPPLDKDEFFAAMSVSRDQIADSLNKYLTDNNASFTFVGFRNPHTNAPSAVKLTCNKVQAGGGCWVNPIIMTYMQGDYDGDLLSQMFDQSYFDMAKDPIDCMTDPRPVAEKIDGEYTGDYTGTSNFSWKYSGIVINEHTLRDDGEIQQAFEDVGADKEFQDFKNQFYKNKQGKISDDQRDYLYSAIIEQVKKADQRLGKGNALQLIQNLQQNSRLPRLMESSIDYDNSKVSDLDLDYMENLARIRLQKVTTIDKNLDTDTERSRILNQMSQLVTVCDGVRSVLNKGTNSFLRSDQRSSQASNVAVRTAQSAMNDLDKQLSTMGVKEADVYTVMLAAGLQHMNIHSEPVTQLEGVFKEVVALRAWKNAGFTETKRLGDLNMTLEQQKEMLSNLRQAVIEARNFYKDDYNSSLETLSNLGYEVDTKYAEKTTLEDTDQNFARIFIDEFADVDAFAFLDPAYIKENTISNLSAYNPTINGILDYIENSPNQAAAIQEVAANEVVADLFKMLIKYRHLTQNAKGTRIEVLVKDVVTDLNKIPEGGIQNNRLAHEVRFAIARAMLGPSGFIDLNISNAEAALHSEWGKYLFSNRLSDFKNFLLSFGTFAKWRDVIVNVLNGNYEQAYAAASTLYGLTDLDNYIISEIQEKGWDNPDAYNSLLQIVDPRIDYNLKESTFNKWVSTGFYGESKPHILENALKTSDSEIGDGEIGQRLREARATCDAIKEFDTKPDVDSWSRFCSAVDNGKVNTKEAVAAINYRLANYMTRLNKTWYGSAFVEAGMLTKNGPQKGRSEDNSSLCYQQLWIQSDGVLSSFTDKMTGFHSGSVTANEFADRRDIACRLLSDKTEEVTVQDGGMIEQANRDTIFAKAGIALNGREPTWDDWKELFDKKPQLLSLLAETDFTLHGKERSIVIETKRRSVEDSLNDVLWNSNKKVLEERVVRNNIERQLMLDTYTPIVICGIIGARYKDNPRGLDVLISNPVDLTKAAESAFEEYTNYVMVSAVESPKTSTSEAERKRDRAEKIYRNVDRVTREILRRLEDGYNFSYMEGSYGEQETSVLISNLVLEQFNRENPSAHLEKMKGLSDIDISIIDDTIAKDTLELMRTVRVIAPDPQETDIATAFNSVNSNIQEWLYNEWNRNNPNAKEEEKAAVKKQCEYYAESYVGFWQNVINTKEFISDALAIHESTILDAIKPDNNDFTELAEKIKRISKSVYSNYHGKKPWGTDPKHFAEIKKKYPTEWQMRVRNLADSWNSELLKNQLSPLVFEGNINQNLDFYAMESLGHDIIDRQIKEARLNGYWVANTTAKAEYPDLSFSNRALTYIAQKMQTNMESAGNTINSSQEGGEFKKYYVFGGFGKQTVCDEPPVTMTYQELIDAVEAGTLELGRFNTADDKDNLTTITKNRFNRLKEDVNNNPAKANEKVNVYEFHKCHWGCRHHTAQSLTGFNTDMINPLGKMLIYLSYQASEAHVFKRKKEIGKFLSVITGMSENPVRNSVIKFDGVTDPKTHLMSAMNDYRIKSAEWFLKELEADQYFDFQENDCLMLAQFLYRRVLLTLDDGSRIVVGYSQLANPDFDINLITNGKNIAEAKVVSLGLTGEMDYLSNRFYRKISEIPRKERTSEKIELILKDLMNDDSLQYGPGPLDKALDMMRPLKKSYRSKTPFVPNAASAAMDFYSAVYGTPGEELFGVQHPATIHQLKDVMNPKDVEAIKDLNAKLGVEKGHYILAVENFKYKNNNKDNESQYLNQLSTEHMRNNAKQCYFPSGEAGRAYIFVAKDYNETEDSYSSKVARLAQEMYGSGVDILLDLNISELKINNPSILGGLSSQETVKVGRIEHPVLVTNDIDLGNYPLLYRTGQRRVNPGSFGVNLVGGNMVDTTSTDSGSGIHQVPESHWEEKSIYLEESFVESASMLPKSLRGSVAHVCNRNEVINLDPEALRDANAITHYDYPEGRRAPLGEGQHADDVTFDMFSKFVAEAQDDSFPVTGVRQTANQDDVIAIIRYDVIGGGSVYVPLIANAGAPIHMDAVHVTVDRWHNNEVRVAYNTVLAPSELEGLKMILTTIDWKSYVKVEDDPMGTRPAYTLSWIDSNDESQEMGITSYISEKTAATRDANMEEVTVRENLCIGQKLMPGSAFFRQDENTGDWVRLTGEDLQQKGILISESDWAALSNVYERPEYIIRRLVWNPYALATDGELSAALRRYLLNCLANNVHPATYLSNIFVNNDGKAMSFYQYAPPGAIFDGVTYNGMLKLFHLFNSDFCPNGINDVDSVSGERRTLFDTEGNMLCIDNEDHYNYRRVILEIQEFKRENTALGHQSENGIFGQQQFMNTLNELGLSNVRSSHIARYVDALYVSNGDFSEYAMNGKKRKPLGKKATDYGYVPLSEQRKIAYGMERFYIGDYYSTLTEEGMNTYGKQRRIVTDKATNTPVEDAELDILYNQFYNEFGIDGGINVLNIHNAVNLVTGYSYNDGNGTQEITLDEFKDALKTIEYGIKGMAQGKPFLKANIDADGNRFTMPIGPNSTMQFIYNIAKGNNYTSLTYEEFIAQQVEQMREQLKDIALIKNVKKRRALNRLAHFNLLANGQEVEFGTFHTDISLQEIQDAHTKFLRTVASKNPEYYQNEQELIQQNKDIASSLAKESLRRRHSMKPDASSPSYMGVAYLGPEATGFRKMCRGMLQAMKTAALAEPLIAATSVVGRAVHGGSQKMMFYLQQVGIPAIGGAKEMRLNQTHVDNASKAESVREVWNCLTEIQLNGMNETFLSNYQEQLSDPEFLKEKVAEMKKGGLWKTVQNKVIEFSSGGGAFRGLQIQNFLNYFAQHADPETMPSLFEIVPGTDVIYMEYAIENHPEKFIAEVCAPNSATYMLAQRAKNFALEGDFAQQSCFSIILQHMLKDHEVAQLLFATGVCKFPQYAWNVSGWMIKHVAPVSSICYVARDWLASRDVFVDLHLERTQTVPDLKTAIIRDAMNIAPSVLAGLLAALFLDPPPDDDKWGNVDEWLFMGMRIGDVWYLHDIIGAPLTMAASIKSAELGRPRLDIIPNWLGYTLMSNPVMKASDLVSSMLYPDDNYVDQLIEEVERVAGDTGENITIQDVMASGILTFSLQFAAGLVTPSMLKNLYQSYLFNPVERSYKKVAKQDENGNVIEGEWERTDYVDEQIRKLARNNPIVAVIMDGINLFRNPKGTGYLSSKMPPTKYWTDTSMWYLNRYSVTEKDPETGEYVPKSTEECRAIAYEIIGLLQQYSPEELAEEGFCISYETKQYVSATLWDCIHYLDEQYSEWVDVTGNDANIIGEGDWDEGSRIKQQVNDAYWADRNGILSIYNNLWSEELNEAWQAYNRYNTTYKQDDNGEWYATGFKDYYFMPFLMAPGNMEDPQGTLGYEGDWETPDALDPTRSAGGRALIPILEEAGEKPPIESFAVNGDKDNYSGIWGDLTDNIDWNDQLQKYKDYAKNNPSGSRSGYGYGSRGGGGGGGGSSSPNIYSYLPNLNVQTPKTSSTSTRTASRYYDSLRPNVEKKGSRDAITRGDI